MHPLGSRTLTEDRMLVTNLDPRIYNAVVMIVPVSLSSENNFLYVRMRRLQIYIFFKHKLQYLQLIRFWKRQLI